MLQQLWFRNTGGGTATPTISTTEKINGLASMQVVYDAGAPGYAGLEHLLSSSNDWSGYRGLSVWVNGDNSKDKMVVQFETGDQQWWEAYPILNFSGWKQLKYPFSNVVHPSWEKNPPQQRLTVPS